MTFAFLQNIGPWQLLIFVAVAFVLFGGAKKIPELAKSLGKAKSEFKKGLAEFVARGGKVIGFKSGVKMLPPGGVACAAPSDVVDEIRKLFKSN